MSNMYFRRLLVLHMPSVQWGKHKAPSSEVIKLWSSSLHSKQPQIL